jgi:hypothetical protein
MQMIAANGASALAFGASHRRNEQPGQQRNNGDYYKQFNQSKSGRGLWRTSTNLGLPRLHRYLDRHCRDSAQP